MNRNFTIFYSSLGVKGSRYSDIVPINVAKKFAKKIFSNNNICKIDFCIRETTRNSKKKLYHYIAIRKGDNIKVKSNRKKIQKGGGEENEAYEEDDADEEDDSAKVDTFNKRQNARRELCNFMVDFVLDCADGTKKVEIGRILAKFEILKGQQRREYGYYTKGKLSEETCALFSHLVITYERVDNNLYFFSIKDIFLSYNDNQIERGGSLLYAIIQGLKMGLILLKVQDYVATEYIINVNHLMGHFEEPSEGPVTHISNYFHKTEGFKAGLSNIRMSLKRCDDGYHYYWDMKDDADTSIERYYANNKDDRYPLIKYNREPLFINGSRVALLIKEYVFFLILEKLLDIDAHFGDDPLVQTVFNKFEITIKEKNLVLDLDYKNGFQEININDSISKRLRDHCGFFPCDVITSIHGKSIKKSPLSVFSRFFKHKKLSNKSSINGKIT